MAALKGNSEMVLYLIKKGADVNKVDRFGMSPLYAALYSKDLETAKTLIEKGAHLNYKAEGKNILEIVNSIGVNQQISDYLKWMTKISNEKNDKLPLIFEKDEEGRTPFLRAVAERNYEEVDKFLSMKNPQFLNAVDNNKQSALMIAISNEDEKLCLKLILKGINIHLKDNLGSTALSYCANKKKLRKVMLKLIEKGADVNTQDNFGYTPLTFAILSKQFELARDLLKNGADPTIGDMTGMTPLSWANFFGYYDICEYILENNRR